VSKFARLCGAWAGSDCVASRPWQRFKITGTLASGQTGLWTIVRQYTANGDDWTSGDIHLWGACIQQGNDPQRDYARTWASQTLPIPSGVAVGRAEERGTQFFRGRPDRLTVSFLFADYRNDLVVASLRRDHKWACGIPQREDSSRPGAIWSKLGICMAAPKKTASNTFFHGCCGNSLPSGRAVTKSEKPNTLSR
jgi:hypothetical protein